MTTGNKHMAEELRITTNDPMLTAYALGELEGEDRARVEDALASDPTLRAEMDRIQVMGAAISQAMSLEDAVDGLDTLLRSLDRGSSVRLDTPLQRRAPAFLDYPGLYFIVGGLAAACFGLIALLQKPLGDMAGPNLGVGSSSIALTSPATSASREASVSVTSTQASSQIRVLEDTPPAALPAVVITPLETPEVFAPEALPPVSSPAPENSVNAPVVSVEQVVAPEEATADVGGEVSGVVASVQEQPKPVGPLLAVDKPETLITALKRETPLFNGFGAGGHLMPFDQERGSSNRDFVPVAGKPQTILGVQTETASYAQVRRALSSGRRPDTTVVHVEQLLNSFDFAVIPPEEVSERNKHGVPAVVATAVEYAPAPWNPRNLLVRIALQASSKASFQRPAERLLVVVQDGMPADSRRLLAEGLRGMVCRLNGKDRVTLLRQDSQGNLLGYCSTEAGAGRWTLHDAIDELLAKPSETLEKLPSNLDAFTQLAIRQASRVIVCGGTAQLPSSLLEGAQPISLLVAGRTGASVSLVTTLAERPSFRVDRVETVPRARECLLEQAGHPEPVAARGASLSVSFNPDLVSSYRLIGYEGGPGAYAEADPGDLLAGQSFTALYEVVPTVQREQSLRGREQETLLDVRISYEDPLHRVLRRHHYAVLNGPARWDDASADFRFAAAVAATGMVLRDSPHRGVASLEQAARWIQGRGVTVPQEQRDDFARLLAQARAMF